jgi:nitrate reductase gamma subunit
MSHPSILPAHHLDGSMMTKLAECAQHTVAFRGAAVDMLSEAGWVRHTDSSA